MDGSRRIDESFWIVMLKHARLVLMSAQTDSMAANSGNDGGDGTGMVAYGLSFTWSHPTSIVA
jgi:hypothetical protein